MSALPPATLEGWYALHQIVSWDWALLRGESGPSRARLAEAATALLTELASPAAGWSAAFQLVGGGGADFMLVHFRETPDELGEVQLRLRHSEIGPFYHVDYDYFSVTEAGMYHPTSEAAKQAEPGSDAFRKLLDDALAAERESPHVRTRLYPSIPEDMPYVSFYPMTKRRVHPDNWYTLPIEERNRLMREHGMTGRRFARRIFQVITGSVGFAAWEWGVTLFARDPLDIKRVVTEMRYDEASSRYGEFGDFYAGVRITPEQWGAMIG
ncbi:MAG TPA: chlorite dismutase family protein [Longimicrobiales bacterium]|nr:chlorite dismutase family protein [Longimicrobiales bacterium]